MKKLKSLIAAIAIIAILVGIQQSIAYFTAKDQADNVFTVGTVDISLDEPSWDKSADHTISPGVSYEKNPTVHNIGDTDAYVRIRVQITDYAAFSEAQPGFDFTSLFKKVSDKWIQTGEAKVDTTKDTVELIYTFKEILPAGSDTDPLFKEVTIPSFADTDFVVATGGAFDVIIFADAIQADEFSDYQEAFAAFNATQGN